MRLRGSSKVFAPNNGSEFEAITLFLDQLVGFMKLNLKGFRFVGFCLLERTHLFLCERNFILVSFSNSGAITLESLSI